MIKYLVATVIVCASLIMPSNIVIPMVHNSTLWLFLVLVSGFLGIHLIFTKINIWIKSLAIYLILSSLISAVPYLSFTSYIYFVVLMYFYLLCKKVKDFHLIERCAVSILILNVLLMTLQYFNKDGLLNWGLSETTNIGIIGNGMMVSSYFICLSPFLLLYSVWFIIPLFLIVVFTKTSGALIALFSGIIFYIITRMKRFKLLTIGVLIFMGVVFFLGDASTKCFSMYRGEVWKRTISMSNERYASGWGMGTYKLIFPAVAGYMKGHGVTSNWWYGDTQGMHKTFRRAHNCYLQILFETGYIGLGLFLGFIGYLMNLYRKSKKTHKQVICMSSAVMVLVSMIMYFPTRMVQTLPLLICFAVYFERIMED